MGFDDDVQEQIRERGYTIIKREGHGAFGILYQVKSSHDDTLALKVLVFPEQGKYAVLDAVKSLGVEGILEREKAAIRFRHDNIVRISQSFSIALKGVNIPCIVEEWLDGFSLEDVLKESTLPRKEQVTLLEGIASAVGYIHNQGWSHRDIKPANVKQGVLLDFSIAEQVDDSGRINNPHPAQQSKTYVAPEVESQDKLNLHNYDAKRADVYSFGLLMSSVFAGRIPHNDDDKLFILNTLIPHQYKKVIKKCLEKDPAKRYADGNAVYKALRDAKHYYARLSVGSTIIAGIIASFVIGYTIKYTNERIEQAAVYAEQCNQILDTSPMQAEQLCKSALALDERVDAFVLLGHSLLMQLKYDDARQVYDEAYIRNPDILKQLRLKTKDIVPSCVPFLLEYVYQKEQKEEDGIALVHVLVEQQEYGRAAELLQEKKWQISTQESLAVAEYFESNLEWQSALYFLNNAKQTSQEKSEKADILYKLGVVYSQDGQYDSAIKAYREANKLVPHPDAFVKIAELWYSIGNISGAQGALAEAAAEYSDLIIHERRQQRIISEKSGYFDTAEIEELTQQLTHVRDLQREFQ